MVGKNVLFLFQVLIVGGGDGGVAREILKHPSVEKVVVCEIDEVTIWNNYRYNKRQVDLSLLFFLFSYSLCCVFTLLFLSF